MAKPHRIVDLSERRRVLAAGDVHGEIGMLDDELARQGFDPDLDTLVLLGDLGDRGPDSMAALELVARPSVIRVLGNHDGVARAILDGSMSRSVADMWGAEWLTALPRERLAEVAAVLEDAPVSMTVLTPGGRRVGFSHADCLGDWDDQIASVSGEKGRGRLQWVTDMTLMSRETIREAMRLHDAGLPVPDRLVTVAGIDHVFHGHTDLARPATFGNRSWIDTGACYGRTLTVVDVDDWIGEARWKSAA